MKINRKENLLLKKTKKRKHDFFNEIYLILKDKKHFKKCTRGCLEAMPVRSLFSRHRQKLSNKV